MSSSDEAYIPGVYVRPLLGSAEGWRCDEPCSPRHAHSPVRHGFGEQSYLFLQLVGGTWLIFRAARDQPQIALHVSCIVEDRSATTDLRYQCTDICSRLVALQTVQILPTGPPLEHANALQRGRAFLVRRITIPPSDLVSNRFHLLFGFDRCIRDAVLTDDFGLPVRQTSRCRQLTVQPCDIFGS